ncbi:MAG: hypothetical protein K2O99_05320 [Lachnospiraceae bacterium]|nr:hypothetical protein [Lachnospiraceae bacterium]MDE7030087.1 hypothetical protein [Lachnospiraceae bacterium]
MEEINYITDAERENCQRVADAFAELYEMADVVVADAGKYGFVKLQYYMQPQGFEVISTYTDSEELFEDLWQDWFEEQMISQVLGTPFEELDYDEIFARLSAEKQDEIMAQKQYFREKANAV